jgi:hypothetical protein
MASAKFGIRLTNPEAAITVHGPAQLWLFITDNGVAPGVGG